MTFASRMFCALALAAVFAAPQALAQDDVVKLKDGKEQTGRIKTEDWKGVEIQIQKKAATSVPWEQIASISYGSSPELQHALDSLNADNFAEAVPALEKLKDAKEREPIRQQAMYRLAVANERQGKADEAAAAYKELLKAFPTGRFVMPAGEALIALEQSKGDPAATVDELTKEAKGEAGALAMYGLLKGRALEAKKGFADARAAYETVQKTQGLPPALDQEARLGIGRAMQGDNKPADAEPIYRKLTTEGTATRVLAGAWNGLGDIYLDAGTSKRDQDKLLDALYCYLRGAVQYVPAKGEASVEYERALAGSAKSLKYIADLEKNADRKKLFAARSTEKLEQLRRQFPGSRFLEGT